MLVVNIGSVCERKGQHIYIQAVDLLKTELAKTYPGKRIQFLMVGARPGLFLETLKEEIARLGVGDLMKFQPETGEIFDYYQVADIFVCTSFEESFPRVLLESAAFRRLIVSTNVNGIAEMIGPDEAWLMPPGDRYRLAEGLQGRPRRAFRRRPHASRHGPRHRDAEVSRGKLAAPARPSRPRRGSTPALSMRESAACFHNLEWPPENARLAGPLVWLRGWIVGRCDHDFVDVRVRHGGGTHLGVLGLPRTDLAAHFQANRPWLPAEFILGVPVADGPVSLTLETMDAHGGWHDLQHRPLSVAPDGSPPPRVEGRLETRPEGTWTVRDAHHPFHGHLDDPGPTPALVHGRAPVFGWQIDETRPQAAVLATSDTLVFNHLAHSLTDEKLAAKVSHPGATRARLRGPVDCPATASRCRPVSACTRSRPTVRCICVSRKG